MDLPKRLGQGARLYGVLLGSALLVGGVWWVNSAVLGNSTDETGWPVIVGVVVVPVVVLLIVNRLFAESEDERYESHDEPYDWQS